MTIRPRDRVPYASDFKEKYTIEIDGCWRWLGAVSKKRFCNYGAVRFNGVVESAHVVAFTLFVLQQEEITPEIRMSHIHHVCGNTLCVNPAHLQSVEPEVNRAIARSQRVY